MIQIGKEDPLFRKSVFWKNFGFNILPLLWFEYDGEKAAVGNLKPDHALKGETPAQEANINLELGRNKWLSLIKKRSSIEGIIWGLYEERG